MKIKGDKLTILSATATTVLILSLPTKASTDTAGLQTNIAVDVVGTIPSRGEDSKKSHFKPRDAEIAFHGPIDHLLQGWLGVAAHEEDGKAFFELHEAYIATSMLIPHTRVRMGQFFLPIGRLNSTHRHEWPFIFAPEVQKSFFGNEGIADSGFEFTSQLPTSHPFEVSMGMTQGWTFGHTHNEGFKPKVPTHYARFSTFFDLKQKGGLQTSINALRRVDSNNIDTTLIGLDSMLKWRERKTLPFLLQAELWWRSIKPFRERSSEAVGYYFFPQIITAEDLYLGILYDQYEPTNLRDANGQDITQRQSSWAPTLTWKPSEFSTFRLNYTWNLETNHTKSAKLKQSFLGIQSTFILGAHPAHDF